MSGVLLSVVLPVHDQADHLATVVEELIEPMGRVGKPYELLLVPNGCHDESPRICEELASQHAGLRVLTITEGGWGRAVRHGLRAAKGDLLCYTNAARTAPEDLALMLLYATAYPDVVVKANRKIRERWTRRLGSLVYNVECRTLFDLSNWDVNGTPKVFPRRFAKLLELRRDDDLIDAEFSLVCRREGYPMVEVPIFSYRRHGGRSTTTLGSAVRMYWGAYRLWRDAGR